MAPKRKSRGGKFEQLETREMLSAVGGSAEFRVSKSEFESNQKTIGGARPFNVDVEYSEVVFRGTVEAGSATGSPADSPTKRIDKNDASARFPGVGSISIVNPLSGTHLCTGSVIDSTHVLTAGHCFDANSDGKVDVGVLAGTRFSLHAGGAFSSSFDAVGIDIHPDFNGFNTGGANDDFAVITLAQPVPVGTQIFPIGGNGMSLGEVIELVGYGVSGFGDVGGSEVFPESGVKRWGKNEADLFVADDEGSGFDEVFLYDFDGPTDTGFLGGGTLGNDIETVIRGGDSGGPALVMSNGELTIVGMSTFEFSLVNITSAPGEFGVLGGGLIIGPGEFGWISSIATGVRRPGQVVEPPPASRPVISVVASQSSVTEGSDEASFRFSRSGDLSESLIVNFAVEGTASAPTDYSNLPTSIIIPGGSASVSLTLDTRDDSLSEATETVSVTLRPKANYQIGANSSATIQIIDDDAPAPVISRVSISTSSTTISEGSGGVDIRFARDSNFSNPLTVNYSISGNATPGADFTALSGTLVIGAGQSSGVVQILPIDDSLVEGSESIVITLQANSGYTFGSPTTTTITILDNDFVVVPPQNRPEVSIRTDSSLIDERFGGTDVIVSRDGSTQAPLTILYSVQGDATNGVDFIRLPGSVTIPSGSSSSTIRVTSIDDTFKEDIEFAYLLLIPDAGYKIGSPETSFAILDDDDGAPAEGEPDPQLSLPQVSVTSDVASISEASGGVNLRFSRSGNVSSPLTVRFTTSGTALTGVDYRSLGGQVTIPAGSSTTSLLVAPIDDSNVENDETVIVSLTSDPNYDVGPNRQTTILILDNDAVVEPPTDNVSRVSVAASAASVSEGAGVFQLSFRRSGTVSNSITVRYRIEGTATPGVDYTALSGSVVISAGTLSRTVAVSLVDDSLAEGTESIRVTILPDAEYSIESPSSTTIQIVDNDSAPPQGTNNQKIFAIRESSARGFVSDGNLSSTTARDNRYEVLQDSADDHRLVHQWEFQLPDYQSATMVIDAHRSVGEEPIRVDYSIDGIYFRNLFTITKTFDDDRSQSRQLPNGLEGSIFIRVRDSALLGGDPSLNVFVDYLAIHVSDASGGASPATVVAASDHEPIAPGRAEEPAELVTEVTHGELAAEAAAFDFDDAWGIDLAELIQSSFSTDASEAVISSDLTMLVDLQARLERSV